MANQHTDLCNRDVNDLPTVQSNRAPQPIVSLILEALARRPRSLPGNVSSRLFRWCDAPRRFVDHWNARRDLLLCNQPVEVRARTIGRISREPLGLDTEAPFGDLLQTY
jgi:hypothetical protein